MEEALGIPREMQRRRDQMEVSDLLQNAIECLNALNGKHRVGSYGVQRASKNKEDSMDEKTHMITCRLDEPDFQKLKSEAAAMELNTSDYIRLLTRLPIECKIGEDPDSFVIIDPRAQGIMDYQIRKQGILLNQAAHALNTIALKIRHGAELETEMLSLMKKATKSIDAVRCGLDDLKLDSEAIVESRKLYLDIYRRKPK